MNTLGALNHRLLRLLIVEDDPAYLRVLDELLAEAAELAFDIVHAARVNEAVQSLEQQPFDLILLDLHLPDSEGSATVITVHSTAPGVPIIVLSTGSEKAMALEALRHGAQDYLVKDRLDPDLLERSIQYALVRSEVDELRRMDAVVQAADVALYGVDLQNRITNWNRAAERLYGYRAAEAIGRPITILDGSEGDRVFESLLRRTRAGEHLDDYESQHTTSEGQPLNLSLTVTPIVDHLGEIVGSSVMARDTSEQKRAEETLRQNEERLRLMIGSVRDYAIFMLDPTGRVGSWNLGAQRIKGYTPEEIIGQHYSMFYPEEDRARGLPDHLLQTATLVGRVEHEGWRVRKDGSRFWASVVISAVRDDTDKLVGFVKVTRDMSERRQMEESLRESEIRYRSVYDVLQEALILKYSDGTIRAVNASAEQLLGLSREQLLAGVPLHPEWQIINEDGSPVSRELLPLERSLATGEAGRLVFALRKPDNTVTWILGNAQPLFHEGETKPYAVVGSFIDITEIKRLEQSLKLSEERHRSLFEHSLDAIFLTHPDGDILAANPAATTMFRMSEAELIEAGRSGIMEPNDPRLAELLEERAQIGSARGQLTMRRGDGTRFPAEISSTIFRDSTGTAHSSLFIRDMTEQQALTDELTSLAFYDLLTGLPNRALFMDRLDQQVQRVKRDKNRLFAVLFVDLDHFKDVNDTMGHSAGDLVLIEVARRLKACVRANDTVARLAGDEFTIILDGIEDLNAATITADRIQSHLSLPFYIAGVELFVTASLGIAISTSGYTSAQALLRDADSAMYRAKGTGKARYVISDDAMRASADGATPGGEVMAS